MESPVILEKPPEYHQPPIQNKDKGFPFDEEETADGAWSELAARHPDIAARLRTRPSAWARKRRPSHNNQPAQDADDFVSGLGEHFNRFPFDDIPPEFREHIPGHWGQRFVPQERVVPEPYHQPHQSQPQSDQSGPARTTIATQTEEDLPSSAVGSSEQNPQPSAFLPQYGLRNTVDLGQKTPADPSLVDAESERNQRSMSAPPDNRVPTPNQQNMGNMMSGNPPPQQQDSHEHNSQANVRHIPIFVEGRDEPLINKSHPEPAVNYAEPKQQPQSQPQYGSQQQPHYAQPPPEREYYFDREPTAGFDHPPNFSRTFGSPFGKGFRQGPQPFAPQKAYQQNTTQGRPQSPKPQMPPQQHYTQIPVQHEHAQPPRQQNYQQPQQQHYSQPSQHRQQSPQPPTQPASPPQQAPPHPEPLANDSITKILSIQKDVLDLMTEVENFVGTKADKRYIYLDEMLTRNLIKLDNIETEGKENIRQARKEAIKCIQKCIAVLEAKADGKIPVTPQPNSEVQMNLEQNGEVVNAETVKPIEAEQNNETKEDANKDNKQEPMILEEKAALFDTTQVHDNEKATENKRTPDDTKEATEGTKSTPKKTKKIVKKRDKSKDKKEGEEPSNAQDNVGLVSTQECDSKQTDGAQPMETEALAVSSQ